MLDDGARSQSKISNVEYKKLQQAVKESPELRAHNLDMSARELATMDHTKPVRDATQADFGAEYHGFTGFERANKGSNFRRKRRSRSNRPSLVEWVMSLLNGGRT